MADFKDKHELGDKPIEEKYREQMNFIAKALDTIFNPDWAAAKTKKKHIGFVLLVFPFGEKEGRCNYISNGADRNDIVKMLREQANRFDKNTQ